MALSRLLVLLAVALGMMQFAFTTPSFSQPAHNTTDSVSPYDLGLRHFYWFYAGDPSGHQRRDWYQESPAAWSEVYGDGRYNHSRVVDAHAVVDGNSGIICVAETSTLRMFIPDRGATGSNPTWLWLQQEGQIAWPLFAEKIEVDPPQSHDARIQQQPDFNNLDLATTKQRATGGDPLSQALLAFRYQGGISVSRDDEQALAWYKKSADQGYAWAQNQLGLMYYEGHGTPQDFTEALARFRQAADQGMAIAQFYLGIMNERGNGPSTSSDYARVWFQMAADRGMQTAKDELAKLNLAEPNSTPAQNGPSQTVRVEQSAPRTGDMDPNIILSDLASNIQQLQNATNLAAQNKLSISKSSRQALKADKFQKSRYSDWLKHCNDRSYSHTWSTTSDKTAQDECMELAGELAKSTSLSNPDVEAAYLRACGLNGASFPCDRLGRFYAEREDFQRALLAFNLPVCSTEHCLEDAQKIYKQLGAVAHVQKTNEALCHDLYHYGACKELSDQGEAFDYDTWSKEKREYRAEADQAERERVRQLRIDRAEEAEEKQQRHDAVVGLVQGLADTAVSSYGDYKAGIAQARVNTTAIQLAQENKSRGGSGYPTTSSGGSSGTSTPSATSTKPAPKSSSTAADSPAQPDSSDTSSATSSSGQAASKSFNPYSSTGDGSNPYSVEAVPADGATIPGERGHWTTEEVKVGAANVTLKHANINMGLVDAQGGFNWWGAYISFNNPDKLHPFYYGFAGVINEKMEAGVAKIVSWPAPYLAGNRPNPPFEATVSIRYFAIY